MHYLTGSGGHGGPRALVSPRVLAPTTSSAWARKPEARNRAHVSDPADSASQATRMKGAAR
jgi:hypothetical protein